MRLKPEHGRRQWSLNVVRLHWIAFPSTDCWRRQAVAGVMQTYHVRISNTRRGLMVDSIPASRSKDSIRPQHLLIPCTRTSIIDTIIAVSITNCCQVGLVFNMSQTLGTPDSKASRQY